MIQEKKEIKHTDIGLKLWQHIDTKSIHEVESIHDIIKSLTRDELFKLLAGKDVDVLNVELRNFCSLFNILPYALRSENRNRDLVSLRYSFVYYIKKKYESLYNDFEIMKTLNRDRTSYYHAITEFDNKISVKDKKYSFIKLRIDKELL